MKDISPIIPLVLLTATGAWLYYRFYKHLQKQQELKEKEKEVARQKSYLFFKSKLDVIKTAVVTFSKLLDSNSGYFTNYQLSTWKDAHSNLFNEIQGKSFEAIQLSFEEVSCIKSFKEYFQQAERLRNAFNAGFVIEELKRYQSFFDNVEGRKLDVQQRTAVVTDEDNNLVVAGAGSGKTTTIVGKVNYVMDRYKVSPDEILLISFTNKSASTLAGRINREGVEAKTFHKFGKDIIALCEGRQPSIFDENQFKPLLTNIFETLLKDGGYLEKITSYFTGFLKPEKSQFEFDNQGAYIQYLKDKNFRSYKLMEIPVKGKMTYKMELVKSIEECRIANFLLFNGITYEYEYPYEFDTATMDFRQYKPDFTIFQNGRKVYLEHFAVARNGDVPPFFAKVGESRLQAKTRYWEKISWARSLHEANETTLIESYSYEMGEGILFENLAAHLIEAGITLKQKTSEEIWEIIKKAAKDEVNGFVALCGTFITLLKSNNYALKDVIEKNRKTTNEYFRKRNALFIEIIQPIYDRYETYLKNRGEIDFSDMINKAAGFVETGRYNRRIKYVVIDEFQDISIGRYQLIKAIKKFNPISKLFAVGDDWQSIYRFSGSDITLFSQFEKYFGYSVKSKIETTYRFNNPLIDLSSEFILKNPSQTKKSLIGIAGASATGYSIHYSRSDDQDDTLAVQQIFDQILLTGEGGEKKEVFILGRYSFDINRLKNKDSILSIDKEQEMIAYSAKTASGEIVKRLKAKFMTVHKAKGLEADVIIVLNCNSGKYGFPSEMTDDPVLNLLLSEADQFENGEERRLFYVAMTRAKEKVYFVADSNFKSKFILELEVESKEATGMKCPNCKNADVVLRKSGTAKNGNTYKFYGCSNYAYGCEYTNMEWINY